MHSCSLVLTPFQKSQITVNLWEINELKEHNSQRLLDDSYIFSDLTYEAELKCSLLDEIRDVDFYINDVLEPTTLQEAGRIVFKQKNRPHIFLDCYGFVKIGLDLHLTDDRIIYLQSDYLPVLVRQGELNNAVKAMVQFIDNNYDDLLFNGELKPKDLSSIKENGRQNFESQLLLAEQIVHLYESSYGFFKANHRFKIEKVPVVDYIEHAQYISHATMQYIAFHPEQLNDACNGIGIRIGTRTYQPNKVLSLQSKYSYDIYENRIVVSFLRKIASDILDSKIRCDDLLKRIPTEEIYNAEYVRSSFFVFSVTYKKIEKTRNRLQQLYDKIIYLWNAYESIMPFGSEIQFEMPEATSVFLSIPQYNKVFVSIYEWNRYGIYDFEQEKQLLSYFKISYLYESYLLAKLICYFKDKGLKLTLARRHEYKATSSNWKYKNTSCNNTFVFSNEDSAVKLYYQPVIYSKDRSSDNGVYLYRNNSISYTADPDKGKGSYYAPDFLIEINNLKEKKYFILDAKFSESKNVRELYFPILAFKYLFSLSCIGQDSSIVGLYALYGKYDNNGQVENVYDKQIKGEEIKPEAKLIPIIEKNDAEEHYKRLDELFLQYL